MMLHDSAVVDDYDDDDEVGQVRETGGITMWTS